MQNPDEFIRQAGALPIRRGRFCLITSRNGKRFVIPKGWIEIGQTASETAVQEAWEEAGIAGAIDPDPIGGYYYEKEGRTYHVTVFIMRVTDIAPDWPERSFRERTWVTADEFLERVDDIGLIELVRLSVMQNVEPAIAGV
jgi:8-oxo-dGTP pyrophosphatase MutT (NUDIX family)